MNYKTEFNTNYKTEFNMGQEQNGKVIFDKDI